MSNFSRDAFKASSVSSSKEAEEKVDKLLGVKKGAAGYLTIEDGTNIFRIYPAHPNEHDHPYYQVRTTSQLPCIVDETNSEGKKTGNKKQTVKHIFNARVHGSAEMDIIEEYIKVVEQKASIYPSKSQEKTNFLKYIYGVFLGAKNPNNINGIAFQTRYVVYANKLDVKNNDKKEFGRLEFGRAVKNGLNDITIAESANSPIEVDPFSDPTEGIAVQIIYNKSASQPADYYKTSSYLPRNGNTIKLFPLSDEELIAFMEQTPLYDLFNGVYGRKDFEFALEGLQLLDKISGYNVFEDVDFLEKVNRISEYYPMVDSSGGGGNSENLPFKGKEEQKTQPVESPKQETVETPKPTPVNVVPPPVVEIETGQSPADRLKALKAKMGLRVNNS